MTTDALLNNPKPVSRQWKKLAPQVKDFFVNIIAQVRLLKKTYPGIMHFFIFWGVSIQVIGTVINILQMNLFLPWVISAFPRNNWYLAYELVMDLAGLFILLGVLMAAFRRYVLRPKTLETHWDDTAALVLLFLIAVVGFTNEGIRLLVTSPAWAEWSPIGNWVAGLMRGMGFPVEQAAAIHDGLVWIHVTLALLLVGIIPFTKMRHLVNTPLNILLRNRQQPGTIDKIENIETTELLGVGKITEFTSLQLLSFDACLRCGRCEQACPANSSGMPYSPKNLIQGLRKFMSTSLDHADANPESELTPGLFSDDYAWYCTTCGACLEECPAFIRPLDEIVDLRRYQVLTTGKMPKSVGDTMRNFERQGNPWGMPPENRMAWADGLDVKELAPGDQTDVLLFTGCAAAFDERNKKVTRSLVEVLKKLNIDFAVLGFDEVCCGETARRMGHEYIFQEFAKQNIEAFGRVKFNRIVTACAHCFNTLKNEYPQMGGNYTVEHHSEFLASLEIPGLNGGMPEGKLTLHDSCYLGRYNEIYSAPRKLLDNVGVTRVEMVRKKEKSFCCGGGGGGMWMETDASNRINHHRLQDALDAKADKIATACPYCLIMFDDAVRSQGIGGDIKIMDIAEILAQRME